MDENLKRIPRFLAIHQWDSEEGFESEEWKATRTEWMARVMKGVDESKRERAVLRLLSC